MRPTGTTRLRRGLVALGAVLALTLAGCSGGDQGGSGGPGSAGGSGSAESPSAAATNYLKVPKGVTLTPMGTELKVGEKAAVAWQAGKKNAAVDLRVTKVERATLKVFADWKLPKSSKGATPYFVHAKVTNVGKADLSQGVLPVYLQLKGEKTLVASSTFQSTFKPCPSTPLPKKFTRGKKATVCLVYLAPAKKTMGAVSFYPGPTFGAVTWSGKAAAYKPAGKKKSTKGSS